MAALTRAAVMRLALNEKGYREGANNKNKYSTANGRGAEYWCQDFAQWVLQRGKVETPITASCRFAESWFKRKKRLHTKPQVGDQFFIYFPSKKRVAHTGFVTGISADGRTVYTIEGNSNPGGSRNGYGVVRRARPVLAQPGRTGIRSYGRPVYGTAPVKPKPTPKPKPVFRVADLERALRLSVDGKWDAAVEHRLSPMRAIARQEGSAGGLSPAAIREAQRASGAKDDGVWGPKSRSAFKKTLPRVQLAFDVAPDGSWGPVTEAKYQELRKKYRE